MPSITSLVAAANRLIGVVARGPTPPGRPRTNSPPPHFTPERGTPTIRARTRPSKSSPPPRSPRSRRRRQQCRLRLRRPRRARRTGRCGSVDRPVRLRALGRSGRPQAPSRTIGNLSVAHRGPGPRKRLRSDCDPVRDLKHWNDLDFVPVDELRDERIDDAWIGRLDEYVATVVHVGHERPDREAFLGRPLAKRLEQRILVGEVLIVGEAGCANLVFDYVFHSVLLRALWPIPRGLDHFGPYPSEGCGCRPRSPGTG